MRGGTAAMGATRYKRHRITNGDLLVYTHLMAEDNQEELLRLRHALGRALRDEVTDRQRQMLFLYYNEGRTMKEIADLLGVDRTTVSRTLKRGEQRILRCLRYGGAALLRSSFGEGGKEKLRKPIDKRYTRGR